MHCVSAGRRDVIQAGVLRSVLADPRDINRDYLLYFNMVLIYASPWCWTVQQITVEVVLRRVQHYSMRHLQ